MAVLKISWEKGESDNTTIKIIKIMPKFQHLNKLNVDRIVKTRYPLKVPWLWTVHQNKFQLQKKITGNSPLLLKQSQKNKFYLAFPLKK